MESEKAASLLSHLWLMHEKTILNQHLQEVPKTSGDVSNAFSLAVQDISDRFLLKTQTCGCVSELNPNLWNFTPLSCRSHRACFNLPLPEVLSPGGVHVNFTYTCSTAHSSPTVLPPTVSGILRVILDDLGNRLAFRASPQECFTVG